MSQKLSQIMTAAVPMPIENIDTDQIIPARFLKATTREGFGENLFRDWRYDANGKPKKDFVLNNKKYHGKILVAGRNFGSGSSREHAAWALVDYGFVAVVSSFFADIFRNNALNNSLVPVQVSEKFLQKLFNTIEKDPDTYFKIDITEQSISIDEDGPSEHFDINPYKKMCIMEGYDDISYVMSMKGKIERFEKSNKDISFLNT